MYLLGYQKKQKVAYSIQTESQTAESDPRVGHMSHSFFVFFTL